MNGTKSIKINASTLSRLKAHLAKKYKGDMYGQIQSFADEAINQKIDAEEKAQAQSEE